MCRRECGTNADGISVRLPDVEAIPWSRARVVPIVRVSTSCVRLGVVIDSNAISGSGSLRHISIDMRFYWLTRQPCSCIRWHSV
jgi:hypothetical protein